MRAAWTLTIIIAGCQAQAPISPKSAGPASSVSPEQTVEQYLSAVTAGEHEKAYALITEADRNSVTLEKFSKKAGSKFKVLGARNLSAEVAVELVGPDPKALQAHMTELMEARLAPEVVARRMREAVEEKRFGVVTSTVHYLVVYEDDAWRVVSGHDVRRQIAEVSETMETNSLSMQSLMRQMPSFKQRVSAADDLLAELIELRRQNIQLWRANHELLDQVIKSKDRAPAAPPANTNKSGEQASKLTSRYASMIKATGPNRFEISRALWNVDPATFGREVRIVPSFANGESNGFKLFSIRPGSLFDRMGMKNGDIVQKVAGIEVRGPPAALRAYDKLKTSRSFEVQLMRGDVLITHRYRAVDERPNE